MLFFRKILKMGTLTILEIVFHLEERMRKNNESRYQT